MDQHFVAGFASGLVKQATYEHWDQLPFSEKLREHKSNLKHTARQPHPKFKEHTLPVSAVTGGIGAIGGGGITQGGMKARMGGAGIGALLGMAIGLGVGELSRRVEIENIRQSRKMVKSPKFHQKAKKDLMASLMAESESRESREHAKHEELMEAMKRK